MLDHGRLGLALRQRDTFLGRIELVRDRFPHCAGWICTDQRSQLGKDRTTYWVLPITIVPLGM